VVEVDAEQILVVVAIICLQRQRLRRRRVSSHKKSEPGLSKCVEARAKEKQVNIPVPVLSYGNVY